jgi:GxxExxY protein
MNADVRDPQTFAIIGAAMTVHRELGHGFLEAVYQEALQLELTSSGIPFAREVDLPIRYKQHLLATHYRADFVCFGSIIVEVKALAKIGGPEQAQILNYLKASGLAVGLLLNFGAPSLEHKRYVWSPKSS